MRIIRSFLIALLVGAAFLAILYFVAPGSFVRVAVAAERAAAGLDARDIEIDGFRINYLDSSGTGEPLVLVHGFGSDKDAWNRVARTLSRHFRIIALDLPGYGESSSPPDAHYGLDEQVARLHAFIEKVGLRHEHLGGFSMGGYIVAKYATVHPNEVGSLWLIANAGVKSAPESELMKVIGRGQGNPLIVDRVGDYRRTVNFVMSRPPFIPDAVLKALAEREVAAHDLREREFEEISRSAPLEDVIKGLPIATHILWGQEDRCLDVGAVEILERLIPDASATILPGIGHLPMLEVPDETAADYLKFRESVSASEPVRAERD